MWGGRGRGRMSGAQDTTNVATAVCWGIRHHERGCGRTLGAQTPHVKMCVSRVNSSPLVLSFLRHTGFGHRRPLAAAWDLFRACGGPPSTAGANTDNTLGPEAFSTTF